MSCFFPHIFFLYHTPINLVSTNNSTKLPLPDNIIFIVKTPTSGGLSQVSTGNEEGLGPQFLFAKPLQEPGARRSDDARLGQLRSGGVCQGPRGSSRSFERLGSTPGFTSAITFFFFFFLFGHLIPHVEPPQRGTPPPLPLWLP